MAATTIPETVTLAERAAGLTDAIRRMKEAHDEAVELVDKLIDRVLTEGLDRHYVAVHAAASEIENLLTGKDSRDPAVLPEAMLGLAVDLTELCEIADA